MPKQLFALIKSLSANEKRYFKLQNFHESETQYTRLFNLLDKINHYDKNLVQNQIHRLAIKNLQQTQNYLYNNILKALRAYREKDSVEANLYNLLLEAQILFSKGLNTQALKILAKARSIAQDSEKINVLLEINQLEYTQSSELPSIKLMEHNSRLSEVLGLINQLREEFLHLDQNFQVFKLYQNSKREPNLEKLDQLMDYTEVSAIALPKTFKTRYRALYTKALSYQMHSKNQESHECFMQLAKLWDQYPKIKATSTMLYIKFLSNFLGSSHNMALYQNFPIILDDFKKLKTRSLDEEAIKFQNLAYYELLYEINTNQLLKAAQKSNTIKKKLAKYNSRIGISRKISFYYNLCILFFALDRFSESLDWVDLILQTAEQHKSNQSILSFARIMELILHFELENDKVLSRLLKSKHTFTSKSIPLHPVEECLRDHMRQLSTLLSDTLGNKNSNSELGSRIPKSKLMDSFKLLQLELDKISSNSAKQSFIGYSEIYLWVRSKVTQKTFRQILKELIETKA